MLCYLFILSLFTQDQSVAYSKKLGATFQDRLSTCKLVVKEANEQAVDPILAVSIAFQESKFTKNAIAFDGKGFGAMQATPRLWCEKKKIENCDLIKAGVKALRTYLELYDWDEYKAVKAYAGKGKKAHEYSLRILRIKTKTQNLLKDLNHENLIIIEN
jgi:hypothetical protein